MPLCAEPGRAVSRACVCVPIAALLALALVAPLARAQVADPDFPAVNGIVQAQCLAGDTLWIGGRFTTVGGTRSAGLAAIDSMTASLAAPMPSVFGHVDAVAPDGQGGWFLGGLFTAVGGVPRQNLAHVRGDGALDAWNPGADREVYALCLAGSTLYAGGRFSTIAGQPRNHLAALDAASGTALVWDPSPNSDVYSFGASDTRLFVGGVFTTIASRSRSCAAAFSRTTGALDPWNPGASNVVRAIAVAGERVYLGGDFTVVNSLPRPGIAAVDTVLGGVDPWVPAGAVSGGFVYALLADDDVIVAGGRFNGFGSSLSLNLAAIDPGTGVVRPWASAPGAAVRALMREGGTLYAGGDFAFVGGQQRPGLAAFDLATGTVTGWNAALGGIAWSGPTLGTVHALAPAGANVLVAGDFAAVGAQFRDFLAGIDVRTGQVLPFDVHPSSNVSAITVRGGTLYVAGDFTMIDGVERDHAAAFDLGNGGALLPWSPGTDSDVRAMAFTDSACYLGGDFANVGGQPRAHLAAVDLAGGALLPWNPGTNGSVSAMAARDTTVFVGGTFSSAGGEPRVALASLDAVTGLARDWNPVTGGNVNAMVLGGDALFVGGYLTGAGGQERKHAAALDPTTGAALDWNPWASSDVFALARDGTTAYLGGYFYAVNDPGVTRFGLAATDSATGTVLPFDAELGYLPDGGGVPFVYSLAARAPSVWVGGDFRSAAGQRTTDFVRMLDTAGFPALAVSASAPVPGASLAIGSRATLAWSAAGGAPRVQSVDLYVSRTGSSGPWEPAACGVPNTGTYGWLVTGPTSDSTWLRVDARDFSGQLASATGAGAFSIRYDFAAVGASARGTLVLAPPAPNPAYGRATIAYTLPRDARVRLDLYDVQGREVAVLADGPRGAGAHAERLDTTALGAGLYFVRLRAGAESRSTRLLVVH